MDEIPGEDELDEQEEQSQEEQEQHGQKDSSLLKNPNLTMFPLAIDC